MSDRAGSPRITPEMLLRAYAIAIFPMAQSRARSPPLLDPPRRPRASCPLDVFHVAPQPPEDAAQGALRRSPADRSLRRCGGRLRRAGTRPAPDLDQRPPFSISAANCIVMGYAHSVETWLDGELVRWALRCRPRRSVLRRKHVQPRNRRQQGGAGSSGGAPKSAAALTPARHPVCHQASGTLRRRSRSRATSTASI